MLRVLGGLVRHCLCPHHVSRCLSGASCPARIIMAWRYGHMTGVAPPRLLWPFPSALWHMTSRQARHVSFVACHACPQVIRMPMLSAGGASHGVLPHMSQALPARCAVLRRCSRGLLFPWRGRDGSSHRSTRRRIILPVCRGLVPRRVSHCAV